MSAGQWIGKPAEGKECWAVELPHPFGLDNVYEHVHAERVRVESGTLVFTDGDVFTSAFVAAYGPNGYLSAFRRFVCEHLDEEASE